MSVPSLQARAEAVALQPHQSSGKRKNADIIESIEPRGKPRYSRNACFVQQNVVPVPYPPGALSMGSGSAASERQAVLTRAGTEPEIMHIRNSEEKPASVKTGTTGRRSNKRSTKSGEG